MDEGVRKAVLAQIDPDETVSFLQSLIRAPSAHPPGDTRKVTERIQQKLASTNIAPRILSSEAHKLNLLATCGDGQGPNLAFHSHLDTVGAGAADSWTYDALSGQLVEGRIYGRGAVDDKGCAAAQTIAFLALVRAGVTPSGTLTLALVADEESGGLHGTRWLREGGHLKPDMLVVGEATSNHVAYTERVACGIDVTFHGEATHGAISWQGHSAVIDAAYAIVALNEELIPRLRERARPGLPPPTINIGTIDGGEQWNIVPSKCVIEIDRRLDVGETREAAMDEIREVLDGVAERIDGFAYDLFTQGEVAPNINTDPSEELVQRMQQAIHKVSGTQRPLTGYLHTSDGRWFAGDGIPIVIFGPGEPEAAHAANESVAVEQVVEAARVYALTALKLLT